jgi:hypothetical protein
MLSGALKSFDPNSRKRLRETAEDDDEDDTQHIDKKQKTSHPDDIQSVKSCDAPEENTTTDSRDVETITITDPEDQHSFAADTDSLLSGDNELLFSGLPQDSIFDVD